MYERQVYREPSNRNHWASLEDPIGSKKYDGAHFFMVMGKDGAPRFFSRRESVKGGFPERTSQLPQLTEKKLPEFNHQVYAVELIHTGHKKDSPESHPAVSGILNSLKDRAIETQKSTGPVRAVLLDVVHPKLETFEDKIAQLKKVEAAFGNSDLLFTPEYHEGHEAIRKLLASTKKYGEEGIIVTSKSKPEVSNPRFKIKHFNTYNLRVKDMVQEVDIQGRPKNSMGALILEDKSSKIVGKVGTGFTRKEREDFWKNPNKILKKLIQVKAMPPTARLLRAPVYNGFSDGNIDTI